MTPASLGSGLPVPASAATFSDLSVALLRVVETWHDDVTTWLDGGAAGGPRLVLARDAWAQPGELPAAGVAVTWHRAQRDRDGRPRVFVAVEVDTERPGAGSLADVLDELGSRLCCTWGAPWRGRRGRYPLWCWLPPYDGGAAAALDVAASAELLRACWSASARVLDELLGEPAAVA